MISEYLDKDNIPVRVSCMCIRSQLLMLHFENASEETVSYILYHKLCYDALTMLAEKEERRIKQPNVTDYNPYFLGDLVNKKPECFSYDAIEMMQPGLVSRILSNLYVKEIIKENIGYVRAHGKPYVDQVLSDREHYANLAKERHLEGNFEV